MRSRSALAVIAALLVGVGLTSAAVAVGPAVTESKLPAPVVPYAPTKGVAVCPAAGFSPTCITLGGGDYVVRHGLGRVPAAVTVTLREPSRGQVSYAPVDAYRVRVHVLRPSGGAYDGPVAFSWSFA